jgi:hypothetical protein
MSTGGCLVSVERVESLVEAFQGTRCLKTLRLALSVPDARVMAAVAGVLVGNESLTDIRVPCSSFAPAIHTMAGHPLQSPVFADRSRHRQ